MSTNTRTSTMLNEWRKEVAEEPASAQALNKWREHSASAVVGVGREDCPPAAAADQRILGR